ncbi:MAG: hypothetical protein K8R87_06000 [Verrucomicrobia bacterium]|nr:hypothetical protein [Verrucomicrobiota bacterium]
MKTPDHTERITRWLDGVMSPAEKAAFLKEMQADPDLKSEVSSLEEIGGWVRDHATLEKSVPNADFFNSQIQDRIAELQRTDDRRISASGGVASWFNWLRMPWVVAGAAALIALGFFMTMHEGQLQTQVFSVYVPNPAVIATVNYNAAAGATVLTLDGLSSFPDDKIISGLNVHHSDNDLEMASTTLYDASGKVLLVMATDARSRPLLLGREVE